FAPGSGQIAIFDGGCTHCNASISSSIDIGGIRLWSDFTGTVTQGPGATINFGAYGYEQAGGNFQGGDSPINHDVYNRNFLLIGGNFNSTSGELWVNEAFIVSSSATFIHNSGKVAIIGDCGCSPGDSDIVGDVTFYNLDLFRSNGSHNFVGNTLTIENNLFVSHSGGGTALYGSGLIDVKGNI